MRPYYIVYGKSEEYKERVVDRLLHRGGELGQLDVHHLTTSATSIIFIDDTMQIDGYSYWSRDKETPEEHIDDILNTNTNTIVGCTPATLDNNFLKNFE